MQIDNMTMACAHLCMGVGGGLHKRACVCIYIYRIGKLTERCDQIRAEDYFHMSHRSVEYQRREQHAKMLLM